jgi:homoserine O-acetyltransferase/O-succinyltransferase
MLVEKKVFELPRYVTGGGALLKKVRVGWESYGTLNPERSNAVLVTHYFSATSHAAGRYSSRDELPGYWDAIIGPGKPVDTDRFFVLSSDTLVNLNARDPRVVTTGPASIDPDTGKRYGTSFPIVSIHDFVEVQKALVESLGIKRLHAVAGPSMGALQAYQWAQSYPDMVERIMPVIGAAGGDPFLIAWLDIWSLPVRLDPKWREGAYPDNDPPIAGLTAALKTVTLHANQSEWAATFGHSPALPGRDPAAALSHRFAIEDALDQFAAMRAVTADANNFLYLIRANQLARADPLQIKAPTLILYSPTDLLFPQPWIERTAAAIRAAGTPVEMAPLHGPNGHLNGVLHIAQASERIAAFLAGP